MSLAPVDPEYAAIILTRESQDSLLTWWMKTIKIPFLHTLKAHHITLMYDIPYKQRANIPTGCPGTAHVLGWAADDRGQAVWVQCDPSSRNRLAHVTISVAEGTPSEYSNELLERKLNLLDKGPVLEGSVQVVR